MTEISSASDIPSVNVSDTPQTFMRNIYTSSGGLKRLLDHMDDPANRLDDGSDAFAIMRTRPLFDEKDRVRGYLVDIDASDLTDTKRETIRGLYKLLSEIAEPTP